MVKILAVDYGEKRIGLAVSDELGLVATPVGVLKNDKNLYNNLLNLIKEKRVDKILVGLPQWDSRTYIVQEIKTFVKHLEKKVEISIDFVNEYYSTKSVIKKLNELGKKLKKKKSKLDAYSACEILQDYLNRFCSKNVQKS